MEKEYTIYKATNTINGKCYIGKTYNLQKRIREHLYEINNDLPFHRALKKYGIENFKWEIIDVASDDIEAIEKERNWILKLNTCINVQNPKGYNITMGGEGGVSWNSRPVVQFDLDGNYVDEFVSGACASVMTGICRKSIESAIKGKQYTAGGYQWKFRDNWNGGNIGSYRKSKSIRRKCIVQLDLDGHVVKTYESVTKASNETGIGRTVISSCLTGKCLRAGGYQWIYESDYDSKLGYIFLGIRQGNGILQLDINGEYVSEYRNCTEAARALNLNEKCHKTIHKALSSESHISYGYKWVKKDEYETGVIKKVVGERGINKVVQLDEYKNLIGVYNGCIDAALRNGFKKNSCQSIRKAVYSETHFSKKFYWYRYEDYIKSEMQ